MLSPVIKSMVELRLGQEIRYPSDCEYLDRTIASSTRMHIGVTTLKRLFGFVRGVSEPRMSTLDVLASYLGYPGYDSLVASLAPARNDVIERLHSSEVAEGEQVRLTFCPGGLWLTKRGDGLFRVVRSSDRQLRAGDVVRVDLFRLRYPLFVYDIIRDDAPQGDCVLAKVSGVGHIEVN